MKYYYYKGGIKNVTVYFIFNKTTQNLKPEWD